METISKDSNKITTNSRESPFKMIITLHYCWSLTKKNPSLYNYMHIINSYFVPPPSSSYSCCWKICILWELNQIAEIVPLWTEVQHNVVMLRSKIPPPLSYARPSGFIATWVESGAEASGRGMGHGDTSMSCVGKGSLCQPHMLADASREFATGMCGGYLWWYFSAVWWMAE